MCRRNAGGVFLTADSLLAQEVIRHGEADHGLANRDDPGNGRDVMTAAHLDFDRFVLQIQGILLDADGRNGLDCHPGDYGLAACNTGQDAYCETRSAKKTKCSVRQ